MVREYEGKSEKDAITKAINDLGLDQEEFDVEIMESIQRGIFKKGTVKIKVHIDDKLIRKPMEPSAEEEVKAKEFLEVLIRKMGYTGEIRLMDEGDDEKVVLDIQTPDSSILIGKKGRNLDSIQLLVNVFINSKYPEFKRRFVIDVENYRNRREEYIIRIANKTANSVIRSKSSKILEPMNPFERRIIHTTLNDRKDVFTKSEGEGHYKRVRVYYKGSDQT